MLRPDGVRDKVGIDENVVGRAESSVGGEEHVRGRDGDVTGQLVLLGRLLLLVIGFQALIAGFDGALHLFGNGRSGLNSLRGFRARTDLRKLASLLLHTHCDVFFSERCGSGRARFLESIEEKNRLYRTVP